MVNIEKVYLLAKEKGISNAFICQKINRPRSFLTDVRQGKLRISDAQLAVIADILDTTSAYLKDETDIKEKASSEISDEDIKFALFGGDGEITDEMYDEVKRFAAYVKEKYGKK